MAALYITSSQAGAGKTMLCAGLGRHLKDKGKKVGFFKPLVADIKVEEAADSDAAFIKRILDLKEPLEDISPVIGGENPAAKVKKAYDKVAGGKDVVIIEGVWRRRPGASSIEAAYDVVKALDAKVIAVEAYSPDLLKGKALGSYSGFGENLLGVVINKVPLSRLETVRGLSGVVGVIPEDRALASLTVGELAERIEGKILNDADRSDGLVENYMLGALTVDSGLGYFGRKANKAVVVRVERPDMQLAALETSTSCLVICGNEVPIHAVSHSAEERGIPIIQTGGNTASVIDSVEQALGMTKFNQEEKLPRLAEILGRLDFKALYKGLGLVG